MERFSLTFFCLLYPGVVFSVYGLFNLTLLHTNDVHSNYPQFNAFGGRCPPDQAEDGKCFGGFSRQVTKVKEIRERSPNVIFLNAGDFYQGTVYYSFYKWEIVSKFVNKLTIDAMSLGNHEFDDGIKGLLPYLEKSMPQVVVCNIDSTKVPEFGKYVKRSVILDVGGEKFGIIGYLTPETKFLASSGDLEFIDEIECITEEAQRLTDEGINKIIVVGHSGFDKDQEIAKAVPQVDIVVGGHSNTFLYTGDPPSVEKPQGPYPLVVKHEDGSTCLVVQAFAFGKYIGYLQVQFDDEGKVYAWSGNPILLDSSVQEDPEILEILKPYQEGVMRQGQEEVGRTNVLLKAQRPLCRMQECNMGNFLADASLSYFIEDPTETGWNSVGIAVWNSGGIRASVDERINNGSILFEDLLSIAPFSNTMDIVGLRGKHLKEVLEYSVHNYDHEAIDPPGNLLQVSGMRVTFNVSMPPGSRVHKVFLRCTDCRVPRFLPLEDEKVYDVVMNTYMAKGGDGFTMIPENAVRIKNPEVLDVDILKSYLKKCSPVITGLEDRITILSSDNKNVESSPPSGENENKNVESSPPSGENENIPELSTNQDEILTAEKQPSLNADNGIKEETTFSTNSEETTFSTNSEETSTVAMEPSVEPFIDFGRGLENFKNVSSNVASGVLETGKRITEFGRGITDKLNEYNPFAKKEEENNDNSDGKGVLGKLGILGK